MNRKRLLILFVTALILSRCSLAPEYTRPEAPVPAQWPHENAEGTTTETSGNISAFLPTWQKFFPDEHLKKVIEISLNNSLDLHLAALNMEMARALYGVQRAELFPSVGATAMGNKQRVPGDLSFTGESMTREQYSVNLGITSWEIDFFGRIRSLKENALEKYLATEAARRSAQIALISHVAQAYFSLAADKQNLDLALSTLETQQAFFNLIQRQHDVGLVNDLDVHRARTQVEVARGDVARYRQRVAQDRNALNLLAGIPIPDELLASNLTHIRPPPDIAPGLPSDVLLNRPDIMEAEHQLKAAYAYIGAARATLFPRISLTSALGTASAELSGLFSSGSAVWNISPAAVIPIFDARSWAAYRVSRVQREMALTQYKKSIQTAFREVADALAVKGTIDTQLSAQESLVRALSETYRLSRARYEKGIDSYLSVLDAQRSLYMAQQGLTSLLLAKIANRVQLYAVLGGGSGSPVIHENESQAGSQNIIIDESTGNCGQAGETTDDDTHSNNH